MDPVIGSALISAGSSLFGGLFGKKKGPSTYQQTQEAMGAQAKYSREYGEQYGFNPLTLLGVSSPVAGGQIYDNPMGQAVADAGMILGDALLKRTDAQKLTRAKERIKELQERIDHDTTRPKIGGVYAQRESSPMLRPSNGGGNARVVAGAVPSGQDTDNNGNNRHSVGLSAEDGKLDPLLDVHPADPRREVDNEPIRTHAGWIAVDNPTFGRLEIPTLDGDEPLHWYDYPDLVVPLINKYGEKATSWVPQGRYMGEGISLDQHPKNMGWRGRSAPKPRPAPPSKRGTGKGKSMGSPSRPSDFY